MDDKAKKRFDTLAGFIKRAITNNRKRYDMAQTESQARESVGFDNAMRMVLNYMDQILELERMENNDG